MRKNLVVSAVFILCCFAVIFSLWSNINVTQNSVYKQIPNVEVFLKNDEISALLPMEKSLWVGGKDGVKEIDYETGEIIGWVVEDISLIYAAQIMVCDIDDSVWIGHNEGVSVIYSDGTRADFRAPEIKGGRVNDILQIKNKMYVGSMQGCSVFELNGNTWKISELIGEEKLANAPVNVLYNSNGDIFFGSYLSNTPGGVSVLLNGDRWQHISTEQELAHPYVNAILEIDEMIFVATGQLTAGGLSKLVKENGEYKVVDEYNVADGIPGEKVRYLYIDTSGYFWITTESDGLIIAKNAQQLGHPINGVVLTEENGLSDNEIKRIVETSDYYWLGGRYGLTRITKQSIDNALNAGGL